VAKCVAKDVIVPENGLAPEKPKCIISDVILTAMPSSLVFQARLIARMFVAFSQESPILLFSIFILATIFYPVRMVTGLPIQYVI